MAFFSRKKKLSAGPQKKIGTTSNISKLRSPYLRKPHSPFRFSRAKKEPKKQILHIAPAPLKAGPGSHHRALWILAAIFVSGFAIYGIFFSHFFDVKNWETIVDGLKLEREHPANQLLAEQKDKNLFFVDEKKLNSALKEMLPDVEKISIKKIFPQKIRVELKKYAIIANIINVSANAKKKFLLNRIGQIADQNNENPELPYIIASTPEPLELKMTAFDEAKLEYILGAYKSFEEKFGMKLYDCEYKARERELHLRTEKEFKIWLDMQKPYEQQLEKLKKAMAARADILDIYKIPLKYIDLRISGIDNEKVIFCRADNPECAARP